MVSTSRGPIHATICRSYDLEQIRNQISQHLDGNNKFKDLEGKRILLKPNILSASDPVKAITTHPIFLEAVIIELKSRGASLTIGDSPGGLFNRNTLTKAYRATGYEEIAKKHGVELNFNTSYHEEKHPAGRFVKSFNIADYIRGHDLIIAIPKIKTHMFTGLTCASKIMFGAIAGTQKVGFHTRFPDRYDFSRMLLDLTDLTAPDLFLVDGILGMEGEGPQNGTPRDVGIIISGEDHISIDLFVSRMVGLDIEGLPILKSAMDLGLLKKDEMIPSLGDGARYKLSPPFISAEGRKIVREPPRIFKRAIVNITTKKPKVNRAKCVGCGVCMENCAGDAIVMIDGKARIDYSKCIRCYCCHELCQYKAMDLTLGRSKVEDRLNRVILALFSRD
ncbi:MAG: DUF362 domain-containing protein [Thermoplasmata archaeon]|nr:DUF362 domain-containing protein [Thermoplasmata archaeon]